MKTLLPLVLFCLLGCSPSPQETYLQEKQVLRELQDDWENKVYRVTTLQSDMDKLNPIKAAAFAAQMKRVTETRDNLPAFR